MKTEIVYQEANMSDVINFFVKHYTPKAGERLALIDYFVDRNNGVIIFKLLKEDIK